MVDASGRRRSRATRIVRGGARLGAAFLGLLAVYVGLVQLDVVRSPLDPRAHGDLELARGTEPGLRVLFVGNSFTYSNDLPALVRGLAAGDDVARPIFAVAYVAPGWSLEAASGDDGLGRLLREVAWDVVVLQERSDLPALPPGARAMEVDPFARALASQIDAVGAETILFMTWAYEEGGGHAAGDTYARMQERLARGYDALGRSLRARVAPVGLAWSEALRRRPALELWADDGRHPGRRGSYLAACVFYSLLAGRPPVGNAFTGELPSAEAAFLQRVAADVVGEETGGRG